jgi:hypothetical protein
MFINICLTFITASMAVKGEKLCSGPVDWLAGVLGIVTKALFLESSRVHPTLLGQRKWLPYTDNARCIW